MKWHLFVFSALALVAPTYADVDPAKAPEAAPAPVVETAIVSDKAVAADSAAAGAPNVAIPSGKVELHLKPTVKSAVVLTLTDADVKASAQDAGINADGMKWYSVEREVTLTGYVDKAAIDKNLDVSHGAAVWDSPQKKEQLTLVDNPAYAKLLEVDKMGKVEVKEPRVLYFGVADGTQSAPMPTELKPIAPDQSGIDATSRRGVAVESPRGSLRSIEAVLKIGNPLFGRKLTLVDVKGNFIAKVDPESPIDYLTFERYEDEPAIYVGELKETSHGVIMKVRSIRLR